MVIHCQLYFVYSINDGAFLFHNFSYFCIFYSFFKMRYFSCSSASIYLARSLLSCVVFMVHVSILCSMMLLISSINNFYLFLSMFRLQIWDLKLLWPLWSEIYIYFNFQMSYYFPLWILNIWNMVVFILLLLIFFLLLVSMLNMYSVFVLLLVLIFKPFSFIVTISEIKWFIFSQFLAIIT